VVEADTVGALYAHLASADLATVASHAWLHAFGVPQGLAARPMCQHEIGPTVGLIVQGREPNSIVAEALVVAAVKADFAATLESARAQWLDVRRTM